GRHVPGRARPIGRGASGGRCPRVAAHPLRGPRRCGPARAPYRRSRPAGRDRTRPYPPGGGARVTVQLPKWWEPLASRAASVRRSDFSRWPTPPIGGKRSAVLILLGEQPDTGPDVLIVQRAHTLRNHAGQAAFPGGAVE